MENALLGARVLLAAIFGLAGAAKLADLGGSRQALLDFGVPSRLAAPAGVLLPVTELGVAGALLWGPGAWLAALVGGLLLLAFVAAIGWNVIHGRTPDCHCFGQVHSEPAGWPTLVRNLCLAAVAEAVVVAGPDRAGADIYAWLGRLDTSTFLGLLAAGTGLALLARAVGLLSGVRAEQRAILAALRAPTAVADGTPAAIDQDSSSEALPAAAEPMPVVGLPVGTPAPDFRLTESSGGTLGLDDLLAPGKPLLLTFVDPQCGPCNALLPDLAQWQRERTDLSLALISRGDAAANRAKTADHGLEPVLLQADHEVAERFQAFATPSMVLVEPDGRIGSPLAQGADAIRALVIRTSAGHVPATAAHALAIA